MPDPQYNITGEVRLRDPGTGETITLVFGGDAPVDPPPVDPPPAADTIRPSVVSITPSVTFSEAMSQATANAVSLISATGLTVPVHAEVSGVVVTLNPYSPLMEGGEYHVAVSASASDVAGNRVGSNSESWFTVRPAIPSVTSLRTQLIQDMGVPHEGKLDGVPDDFDWSRWPKHGDGWNHPGPEYAAALPWGQVYSSETPVSAVVEVADLTMAILSKSTRQWTIVSETKPHGPLGIDGGYFKSDFGGNMSTPGLATTATGTISGTPNPDWNMHFWPSRRAPIDHLDIAGVCCWYDARLVPGSDPRARYLAGAGGDYWQTMDSPYPTNTDIAIGRHRYLKVGEWITLTAHTLSDDDLNNYPLPPVVLANSTTTDPPTPPTPPTQGGWRKPDGIVKVMFVGDSITLSQAEDVQGLAMIPGGVGGIQLVGSITAASTGVRHEGRGAWCADDTAGRCTHSNGFHAGGLIGNIGGWVAAARPDIVVLNIGTNDRWVQVGFTDTQIVEAVGRIITEISLAHPQALTMVTGLKSWSEVAAGGDDNLALNRALASMVHARKMAGAFVEYFDAYSLVTTGDDFTGQWSVHPSSQGIGKMAVATVHALRDVLAAAPLRA